MPWALPEVYSSDGFRTHLIDGAPDDPATRPLAAVLGGALTDLTIGQERDAAVTTLPLTHNLLHALAEGAATVRALPEFRGKASR